MEMDLQSWDRNLSGNVVESWVSGLTDAEGEELMAALGVDGMERIHGSN